MMGPVLGVTAGELAAIKLKIQSGTNPWSSHWTDLTNNAGADNVGQKWLLGLSSTQRRLFSLSYVATPLPVVSGSVAPSGGSNASYTIYHPGANLWQDMMAAWAQAIAYHLNGNTAHADKSIEIMSAWTTSCSAVSVTNPANQNNKLYASWAAVYATRAISLLWDYAGYQSFHNTMKNWLFTVLFKGNASDPATYSWVRYGLTYTDSTAYDRILLDMQGALNWLAGALSARFNIGAVYGGTIGQTIMDKAVQAYEQLLPGMIYYTGDSHIAGGAGWPKETWNSVNYNTTNAISYNWFFGNATLAAGKFVDGQPQEMGRDIGHAMMGLGPLTAFATDMGRNGYPDGFTNPNIPNCLNRYAKAYELMAGYANEALDTYWAPGSGYASLTALSNSSWTPTGGPTYNNNPNWATQNFGTQSLNAYPGGTPGVQASDIDFGGNSFDYGWWQAHRELTIRGKSAPQTLRLLQRLQGTTGPSSTSRAGVEGASRPVRFGNLNAFEPLLFQNLTQPNPPTGVTVSAGSARITAQWTAPANDGGSPISDYVVEYSSNGTSWTTFTDGTSTATTTAITGLTNGTTYVVRVSAVNAVGTSSASTTSASATPTAGATAPGAPTGVVAVAGQNSATVAWAAPTSNGGAAITDYVIQYSSNGGSSWTTFADGTSTNTTTTVTGLTNGVSYVFHVAAVNSAGTSTYSSNSAAVTPGLPGVPINLLATPGNAAVALSWGQPANGGSNITSYSIQYKVVGAGSYTSASTTTPVSGQPSPAYTVTGLVNGTPYEFRVATVNANGSSAYTSTVTATPIAPPPPSGIPVTKRDWVSKTWFPPRSTIWPESFYRLKIQSLPAADQTAWNQTKAWWRADGPAASPPKDLNYLTLAPIGWEDVKNNPGIDFSSVWRIDVLTGNPVPRTLWTLGTPDDPQVVGDGPWNAYHPSSTNLRQQYARYVASEFYLPWLTFRGDAIDDGIINGSEGSYFPADAGDRHLSVWLPDENKLFEAIGYTGGFTPLPGVIPPQEWVAEAAYEYSLSNYVLPRHGITPGLSGSPAVSGFPAGVTAGRLPMTPFMYSWSELVTASLSGDGDLGHMLAFSGYNYSGAGASGGYKWPSRLTDGEYPVGGIVNGTVLRLKQNFDLSTLPTEQHKVVARTLQRYGMILIDKSKQNVSLYQAYDPDYPPRFLDGFNRKFSIDDFEEVDITPYRFAPSDPDNIRVTTTDPNPVGGGGNPGTGTQGGRRLINWRNRFNLGPFTTSYAEPGRRGTGDTPHSYADFGPLYRNPGAEVLINPDPQPSAPLNEREFWRMDLMHSLLPPVDYATSQRVNVGWVLGEYDANGKWQKVTLVPPYSFSFTITRPDTGLLPDRPIFTFRQNRIDDEAERFNGPMGSDLRWGMRVSRVRTAFDGAVFFQYQHNKPYLRGYTPNYTYTGTPAASGQSFNGYEWTIGTFRVDVAVVPHPTNPLGNPTVHVRFFNVDTQTDRPFYTWSDSNIPLPNFTVDTLEFGINSDTHTLSNFIGSDTIRDVVLWDQDERASFGTFVPQSKWSRWDGTQEIALQGDAPIGRIQTSGQTTLATADFKNKHYPQLSLFDGYTKTLGYTIDTSQSRPLQPNFYIPNGTPPAGGWPLAFFVHGGYWIGDDGSPTDKWISDMTRNGIAVMKADYRWAVGPVLLTPGIQWPTPLLDVKRNLRWIKTPSNAAIFNINPDRVAAFGFSAGVHLAMMMALTVNYGTDPAGRDLSLRTNGVPDDPSVLGVFGYTGPVDLEAVVLEDPNPLVKPAAGAVSILLGNNPSKAMTAVYDHIHADIDIKVAYCRGTGDIVVSRTNQALLAARFGAGTTTVTGGLWANPTTPPFVKQITGINRPDAYNYYRVRASHDMMMYHWDSLPDPHPHPYTSQAMQWLREIVNI